MKEFLKALKYVSIFQLICWVIFILCDENKLVSRNVANESAIIIGVILLIVLFVLYFIFIKKIIEKNKLKSTKFNIFLFILWVVISFIIGFILFALSGKYLQPCYESDSPIDFSCFLIGIEYMLNGVHMIQFAISILITKLIVKIVKKIIKK